MWPLQIKLNRVVLHSSRTELPITGTTCCSQNHLPWCIVDRFRFLLTIGCRAALCRALITV